MAAQESAPTILNNNLYQSNVLKEADAQMSLEEEFIQILTEHPELVGSALEILTDLLHQSCQQHLTA